jgi:uncharacterized membrane protein YgcG
MMRHSRLVLAFLACSVTLAGYGSRDPYQRDDVWYPTGANAANLAAQVANPADLAGGRTDPKQLVAAPAKGVNRVWSDSPKPLSYTAGGGSSSGGTSGGGGGGSGGSGGSDSGGGSGSGIPTLPSIPGFGG